MGEGRVRRGIALRMAAGVAFAALIALPAAAQQTEPTELDPTAPLDPMPDLGVAWPDMNQPDPAPAIQQPKDQRMQTVADAAAVHNYRWQLSGLDQVADAKSIETGFEERSALKAERKDAANAAQIDRRAEADAALLVELLRSQGYYDAAVDPKIGIAKDGAIEINLAATPGTRYAFASVALPGLEEAAGSEAEALRKAFAVKAGDSVVAQNVIDAGIALQVALGEQGFATAKVGEQDIVIDHEAKEARLVLPVTPGPVASFGAISVSGKPPFSAHHLGVMARFKPGERFEQDKVDDLRRALVATGLVSAVEVQQVPRDDGKVVDLAVNLSPAPMRTIAGELGYGTGEGVRAELHWQHRNFFNPEGALTLRALAGTQEQGASIIFRRNNWLRRDQVLNAQALADHVSRTAYEARTLSLTAGLERKSNFLWQKKWTWSLGGELLATDERDTIVSTGLPRRRTYFIAAIPASLGYDGSDDLLNPTRGFRLAGRISPEISFEGGAFAYARTQIDASAYHPVSDRVVLAGRVRLGTILGSTRDRIAPSRRFYAGGGGSVRGYAYQAIGPRDVDGNPIGGRSLAEFSLEARVRLKALGGNFGIVPFVDGGSLSTGALPEIKKWQIGVGLGLRYYSSFGPVRIDIGTPVNPQPGDGRIAVVVSLGQAF